MAGIHTHHIRGAQELRRYSKAWDDLWLRSETTLPTARALPIAQWVEELGDGKPFHALIVEHDGQFVAALPLVQARLKRLFPIARMPWNDWSWAGDLLVDPDCDAAALDRLVELIARETPGLLWFDGVPIESNSWRRFLECLGARGMAYQRHERFRIGTLDCTRDFEAYQKAWSGNFRRQMKKMSRRAEELGGVSLTIHRPVDEKTVNEHLDCGFAVEDRSWKGREGTSVLKSPVMNGFLRKQATLLAAMGHLELVFLEFEGRAIAFELGWTSKGWYFSPKVGYDEEYSHLSPGQLLRLKLAERFFGDRERQGWDFLGPLVEATEKWTTGSYGVERLVVSTGGMGCDAFMHAYRHWWPALRRLRDRARGDASPKEAVAGTV
jgi:CelD/BcsL family acetyltransferase involved in cellulose biosynthesis